MRSLAGCEGHRPNSRNVVGSLNCAGIGRSVIDLESAGAGKTQGNDDCPVAGTLVSLQCVGTADAETRHGEYGRWETTRPIERGRSSFAVLLKVDSQTRNGAVRI